MKIIKIKSIHHENIHLNERSQITYQKDPKFLLDEVIIEQSEPKSTRNTELIIDQESDSILWEEKIEI